MSEGTLVRSMLERVGFANAAASKVTQDQGIDSVAELRIMDDSTVTNLCKVLRRPGGEVNGYPDPGVKVSARAEENLKLVVYLIKHLDRTQRPVVLRDFTLASIRRLTKQREAETQSVSPEQPPKLNPKDWPKMFEAIEEYLRQFRGTTGVPLSYVVRKDLVPAVNLLDPSSNYATLDEEMIARAPIISPGVVGTSDELELVGPFSDSFVTDRAMAWEKISTIFQEHESWTYLKPARKTRNGRMAFRTVYDHYLGPNNVDHMANIAERRLRDVSYMGEKRNWTFEKFVMVHKEQHHVLISLEEHGYKGIDERSKVRHLIDGIKTPKLDTIKATILSSSEYRNSFDRCVTLYKDFIKQSEGQLDMNVSTVKQDKPQDKQKGKKKVSYDTKVVDRYYKREEYQKLTADQKYKLRQLRLKRKHGSDDKIASLEAKIAALEVENGKKSEDGSAPGSDEDKSDGNRDHSALTRQKRRKS